MAKKYMPRDVFEVGVATVARMHLLSGKPPEDIAIMAWQSYAASLIDDGVVPDLVRAAADGIAWLQKNNAPALPEFFHHLQWYLLHHDDQGRPKRRKLFNGLLFQRSVKDPDRVANFHKKLVAYYVGLTTGLMPPAPQGWSFTGK